ncbi:EAL domain-containing protein [Vibrio sp. SCSIO 43135]|uniref:GGDEF/EAL domain-containing response regulator n=1 Tax=Vibrio sp. SCSIO 43135 TaxID=2819096 RepID=UPI002074F8EE|nr:EAL domain-containing protein [Vibrio sp. SCSIO 43135]USD40119.1 EAL domain-containing protein [Vibrio sp. SCSIO 43135]
MADNSNDPEELMSIIEDTSESDLPKLKRPTWKVLVVDDDKDVHQATKLAVRELIVEDRPLELIHAYSAHEAEQKLTQEPNIAVILLDVVMETDTAGLDLVEKIRTQLHLFAVRIILRTGQPGYAPEMDTIQQYDINDYRTKSELTRIRLFTILTSAIRAYRQIQNQQLLRQGLEKVVNASTELANIHGLRLFAEGAVKQISALFQIEPEGLICAQQLSANEEHNAQIIAAAGKYCDLVQCPLTELASKTVRDCLQRCLVNKENLFEPHITLYFSTAQGRGIAAYVEIERPLEAIDKHLLEVFCANLSVGFDNVMLYGRLEQQAYVDPLLKVANLNSLLQFLTDSNDCEKQHSTLALVDVDEFAAVNDSFGHQFGDALLKAICTRLIEHFPRCFIARVGSDVFAIVGPPSEVHSSAILATFEQPFVVGEQPFNAMASVGLVKVDHCETELSSLYKDAQLALKQAKHHHRGAAVTFSTSIGQSARDRIQMLAELRESVANNALFLMYQPKYQLETGTLTGIEALLRWKNKHGSLVPPDMFIPLAEQSGLMVVIGSTVLEQACQHLAELKQRGHATLSMAINISPAQLEEANFIALLKETLNRYQLSPQQIEIEVTETMAANDLEFMCDILAQVRALGCKVAIDDFGTGFSSLSVLHRLPATRLKIDRTFVNAMEDDDSIAKMIVNLGQTLGMDITAEGIETELQKQKLQQFGCEEGQGWLFAKALEFPDLLRLIENQE